MATENVSHDGVIKDSFGFPCKIAEAFERWPDPVNDARESSDQDLVRGLVNDLLEVKEGSETIGHALELAVSALPGSDDTDQARALLTMAHVFEVRISNKLYKLVGDILVALERGNLLESNHYARHALAIAKGGKQ